MKLFEKIKINTGKNREREIRFLNIPIIQYGKKEENGIKEKYLELFPKSFEHQTLDKILKFIPKKTDYIFIIRTNAIGEAYLFNFTIEELIEKYNIKHPVIITHYFPAKEVCTLLNPEIPCLLCDITRNELDYLFKKSINYKGKSFILVPDTVYKASCYYKNVINGFALKYPDEILQEIGCENYKFKDYIFSETGTSDITKLNIKNFVYIIPKANSCYNLPDQFWQQLAVQLRGKGYDIYINNPNLSLSQSIQLASQAKAIISMRCGFIELLSSFNNAKHIIYTARKYDPVCSDKIMDYFSLNFYPFVNKNKLFEYSQEKFSNEVLIQEILKEF